MEGCRIEKDITAICLDADSFPGGIADAHSSLRSLLYTPERLTFYGISYSDGEGSILCKAAASQPEEDKARPTDRTRL